MRTQQKRILGRALALMLALVLIAAVGWGLSTYQRVRRHLASAQAAVHMGMSYIDYDSGGLGGGLGGGLEVLRNPDQLAAVQNALATLDGDLAALESLTQPFLPLSTYLGWIPVIGGDIEAAPHLFAMARHSVEAARALSDGLAPLAEHLNQAEPGVAHLAPEVVHALADAKPQLDAARDSLTLAAEARAGVDPAMLSPRIRSLLEDFDRYLLPMRKATVALGTLPELLGAEGVRHYLLVAQNNQELRATGGFISGVGLVRIREGKITSLEFQDSYSVDDLTRPHSAPPAPLRRMMGAGMLLLRDANWWPDFPTSAQTLTELYWRDQGQVVDGVIAVDLVTLQLLLQALGPIEVPGYDQPVSGANLQEMMMTYWQAPRASAPGKEGTDWWLHRKDFAADLLSAVLVHLIQQATLEDLVELAHGIGTAFDERHLLLYTREPQSQSLLNALGWDGALQSYQGDYLMIVDSNVGFNKVNPNIEQTIDYQVALNDSSGATASLSLAYKHRIQKPMPACVHESRYGDSYADLLERCYWDYLRIYVPVGSELLSVTGTDGPVRVYEEAGKMVIDTSFLLETGQARRIQVTYRPRLTRSASRYSLLVQKQPGTDALPLRIGVTPPIGSAPTAVSPPGWAWLNDHAVWQGALSQDLEFEISWD